jgi:hypothetical protein
MIDYGLFDPDNLFIVSMHFPHTRQIYYI